MQAGHMFCENSDDIFTSPERMYLLRRMIRGVLIGLFWDKKFHTQFHVVGQYSFYNVMTT